MTINRSLFAPLVAIPVTLMFCLSLSGCGSKSESPPASPTGAAAGAAAPAPPAPTGVAAQVTKDQQDAVKLENSDGGKSPH